MKHIGKLILGSVMVLIGLILLLENLNILTNFHLIDSLRVLWPIGIIVSGVLIFMKQKGVGSLVLIITIILGVFYLVVPENVGVGELKVESYEYSSEGVSEVVYDISIGATQLNLKKSDNESKLVEVESQTTLLKELNFDVRDKNGVTYVEIEDNGEFAITDLFNFDEQISKLDISLNPNINSSLNLKYGAVDGTLDLRDLRVNKLDIESGATQTNIYLGSYPSLVDINTGASQINFFFPKDIGIEINTQGGVSSTEFREFKKVGSKYYSPNFDESQEHIIIEINSGASHITGELI